MNKQLKKEIDQYKFEEERPNTKINYNYNVQVSSNKELKGKVIEKQNKATSLQGIKKNVFCDFLLILMYFSNFIAINKIT